MFTRQASSDTTIATIVGAAESQQGSLRLKLVDFQYTCVIHTYTCTHINTQSNTFRFGKLLPIFIFALNVKLERGLEKDEQTQKSFNLCR
jgi:hypothetical protein